MKNKDINKKCPFCPQKDYEHTFKKLYGLMRHVLRWHALTKKGEHWWEDNQTKEIGWVRAYSVKYSKHEDFKVNGKQHLEALIEVYANDQINPSMRGIDDVLLIEFMQGKKDERKRI